MIHILFTVARVALRAKIAADQRKDRRQKETEQAEYERLEAVREASDPAYKQSKQEAKQRLALAYRKEADFRTVQTSMFWLSFSSGVFAFFGSVFQNGLVWLWSTWIVFGIIWIAMCFVPKRYS